MTNLGVVAWDPEDDLVASCLVPVTASLIDLGGQDVGVNLTSPRYICIHSSHCSANVLKMVYFQI